jgi:putative hemolysin
MRIDFRVDSADQSRIPASGPVVVVANHPYGVLDGALLTVLLTRVRPDVKILTNFLLSDIPELQRDARVACLAATGWIACNLSIR